MKFNIIYISIITINKVDSYYIQNQNKKICANCKFFIQKDKCSKFGKIDIITGDYEYENAITTRQDEEKCGDDAVFFEKDYVKYILIPFNFILNNFLIIFFISYFIVIFYYIR
jgi:hypothetical protein